jgi:hypothetical protein
MRHEYTVACSARCFIPSRLCPDTTTLVRGASRARRRRPCGPACRAARAAAQVVSNPQLTSFKGLDALSSLGGGLLVVNNSALASLEGLNALGALNATGAASLHGPKARPRHHPAPWSPNTTPCQYL